MKKKLIILLFVFPLVALAAEEDVTPFPKDRAAALGTDANEKSGTSSDPNAGAGTTKIGTSVTPPCDMCVDDAALNAVTAAPKAGSAPASSGSGGSSDSKSTPAGKKN